MALEIERKFLVRGDRWRSEAGVGVAMRQGYLRGFGSGRSVAAAGSGEDTTGSGDGAAGGGAVVRVRLTGADAWLTIKGPTEGIRREEFEYPLPPDDARAMLARLCESGIIEKVRYRIEFAGWSWEVDEFLGKNAGLVVAEIELPSEDADPDLPSWVGQEISDDPRFFNSSLSARPYGVWGAAQGSGLND